MATGVPVSINVSRDEHSPEGVYAALTSPNVSYTLSYMVKPLFHTPLWGMFLVGTSLPEVPLISTQSPLHYTLFGPIKESGPLWHRGREGREIFAFIDEPDKYCLLASKSVAIVQSPDVALLSSMD